MDEPNHYPVVAEGFTRTLAVVTDAQWGLPTPCEDWNVRDLVDHVVATHGRVYAMLGPGADEVDTADESPRAAWEGARGRMLAALSDPELAQRPVRARNGEQPFAALVGGLLTFDTLCHTWDLSRAIGADETLDPAAVAYAHEQLGPLSDALRVPGGFGPAVEPAADADPQTRFLNFVGRRP